MSGELYDGNTLRQMRPQEAKAYCDGAFERVFGGVAQSTIITNGVFGADSDWTKGTGWTISAGKAANDGTQAVVSDTLEKANLAINGTFAADTNWTKGTGWTIAAGVAASDGSQSGDADLTAAAELVTVAGITYRVSFTLATCSAGNIKLLANGNEIIENQTVPGTYTGLFTATDNSSALIFRADLDFIGTVDNVTVYPAAKDAGSGLVELPIAGHSIVEYDTVTIAGSTNYNGTFVVQAVGTNTISILDTYVAEQFTTDVTVDTDGGSMLKQTLTTINNKQYTLTFDTSDVSAGSLAVLVNGVSIMTIDRNASCQVKFVASGVSNKLAFKASHNFVGKIDNVIARTKNFAITANPFDNQGIPLETAWDAGWNAMETLKGTTLTASNSGNCNLAGNYVPI